MRMDPAQTHVRTVYQMMTAVINPRPIAWVSTVSPNGIANLAPFSFFNGVAANPPTVVFSPVNTREGRKKDTVLNIEATKEFVVNIVHYDVAAPMVASSEAFPYEVSEFEKCGLTPQPSEMVMPPRVKEARVQLECVLHQMVYVGQGPLAANLVIGRIVLFHVDDAILAADGLPDPAKLDTIGRMGRDTYCRTSERFDLSRPA